MMWRTVFACVVIAVSACALPPEETRAAQSEAAAPGIAQIRSGLLVKINAFRAGKGLGALSLSPALNAAAQAHAQDMAARATLTHTGADGSDVGDRAGRAGYRFHEIAENVAQGQASVDAVMISWEKSPGHRANMLLPGVTDLGVGYAEGPATGNIPGHYWVIVLGRP